MASIKRLDRLDITATDVKDAASVYQRNFDLAVTLEPGAASAVVAIGDAQISLLPARPQSEPEGMSGLWLEVEDLDSVCAGLKKAGYGFKPIRVENGRRILEVEPQAANQVPLFIFDRKG
jgi:hypothetical protein